MIRSLSSNISIALRANAAANQKAAAATQQLATGKRVASAKENGAAYVTISQLNSDVKQWEARQFHVSRAKTGVEFTDLVATTTLQTLEKLRELVLDARDSAAGSTERAALQAEWNEVVLWTKSFDQTGNNPTMVGTTGWTANGYDMNSFDNFFGPDPVFAHPNGSGFDGWLDLQDATRPVALRGFDILNANATALDNANTSIVSLTNSAYTRIQRSGSDFRTMERLEVAAKLGQDRTEQAISNLQDIDVNKASAQYESATQKAQMSNLAIQNAISHYGAVSSSLLNNVMGTQRSVRA